MKLYSNNNHDKNDYGNDNKQIKDLNGKFQEVTLHHSKDIRHGSQLHHAQAIKCDDERLCDWMKGLAYVIWRTEALRRVIFPAVIERLLKWNPTSVTYRLVNDILVVILNNLKQSEQTTHAKITNVMFMTQLRLTRVVMNPAVHTSIS
ncbi:hypothetical protein EDD18DRAFT_1114609 [Armillaria luteobubalina]|uniref:Uncharacterized protein n=1 Tax=Armillaria luteobubalina TaxID=153913 RepID=A0AA39UGB2_9AGAR|nr:hypothetical protein EDD18DRAFT_1114609 [Armillaria luteobubalina]